LFGEVINLIHTIWDYDNSEGTLDPENKMIKIKPSPWKG
jgi:hypothetical protein